MRMKVQAQALQHDDKLVNQNNDRIVSIIHAGLVVPSGKVEIVIDRGNGKRTCHYWNKRTEIAIERDESQNRELSSD
jgi:hypothetical protein